MNFVLILTLVALPICVDSNEITIGGNFTFQLPFYPGKCLPAVSPYLFPTNKSLLEGRWYAKYLSYEDEQIRALDCYCWDAFFDKSGSVYNFIYAYENGKFVTTTTRLIQIPGKPEGTVDIESYIPRNVSTTTGSLYYTNGEMLVFWDSTCMNNNSAYTRNALVAYRTLKFGKDLKPQTRRILKRLSDEVGNKLDLSKTKQSKSCKYPPKMKNPFM